MINDLVAVVIAVVVVLVLLGIGMYVYAALGIAAIVILMISSPKTLPGISSAMWKSGTDFGFVSILLFVLMGSILAATPVGRRLYAMAYAIFGRVGGGLAVSTTVANAFFAAMCGSAYAATATFGQFAYREMRERSYDTSFASGCIVGAASLAPLIPPSISLIIYGCLTELSIGKLFLGGLVPGILLATLFVGYQLIATARNPSLGPGQTEAVSAKEKVRAVAGAFPAILLIVVVIGSIYNGVASPSEVGALGAVGALVLAVAYAKAVRIRELSQIFLDSIKTTGFIALLMIMGKVLALAFAAIGLPQLIASLVHQLPVTLVIPLFFLILFAMGFILDGAAILVLAAPIMHPVVVAMGYDPIAFGVIFVICIQIGCFTPPVCVSCYVLQGITKEPLFAIVRGSIPYIYLCIGVVVLLILFPQISTFLL